uniref:M-phase phosphoprotein 6 n=1 Tax=Caenorhabditis tropicalis TaxID=1561998 RepID=A0A1I7T439_9PELO
MDNIFSDDDEFDAFHDQLYEGKQEEPDEKLVPMFGMYTLFKTSNKQKPRQDMFLRGMDEPSNDLDPYKDVVFTHKKPDFKKKNLCENFSFFGMKQDKFKMESSAFSIQDHIAERNKQLEKLKARRKDEDNENENFSDEELKKPKTPKTPKLRQRTNADTPRPVTRKRQRRIVLSSDEDSDMENQSERSPRKKRISPTFS